MIFILRQNPIDPDMIEFYTGIGEYECLACVMHKDCLSGSSVERIEQSGAVKVKFEVDFEWDC